MANDTGGNTVKVWDGGLRLFHWALVVAFCLSTYSAFQSKFGIYGDMHTYSGISILVLILWRFLWGFIGSESARFLRFLRGPKQIKNYVQSQVDEQYAGHNPIGGVSVIFALLLLGAQALLGLYASDGMLFSGPFAYRIEYADTITDIHEIMGYTLMGWVGLHLLAIAYHYLALKSNLVKPMITGRKTLEAGVSAPTIASPAKAIVCFLVASAAVYWWVLS
ncbi:cytochrome b/b6 domain-containing protein [Kordiimonas aquimaris]|uniref:cytochrome b/b6 domain-containing protein n=1 Tax=Kordiimonas aquimaris TaxID=707591 RepID=UPI0021CE0069|nr:cytochrome b/b6 domain-containing protein [Kordiimonas aquimaris]